MRIITLNLNFLLPPVTPLAQLGARSLSADSSNVVRDSVGAVTLVLSWVIILESTLSCIVEVALTLTTTHLLVSQLRELMHLQVLRIEIAKDH